MVKLRIGRNKTGLHKCNDCGKDPTMGCACIYLIYKVKMSAKSDKLSADVCHLGKATYYP